MHTENNFKNGTQVLCSLFEKPITLVVAISFAFQVLYGLIGGAGFFIDVFSLCMAIGFFMLYYRAKKKNQFTNFNAPLTLIKVISIINAILNGIAFVMMAFLSFFALFISSQIPEISNLLFIIFLIFSGVLLFYLFYSVSFAVFSGSVKNTSLSLELKKTGAILTGVSGIMYFIIILAGIIVCIALAESIVSLIKDSLSEFLYSEFAISANESAYADLTNIIGISSLVSLITSLAIPSVSIVVNSVYAIYYYSYIKKVEKNYKPERPDYVTPYQNLYGNAQKSSVDYKKASALDPMYAAVINERPKDRIECPYCKSIVENTLTNCPKCGYKLVKNEEK